MDKVLLFDGEMNGLEPASCQLVEAAGLIFSLQHASIVAGFSFVISAPHNSAFKINGIPEALLVHGMPLETAYDRIASWMGRCEVVAAHNASFDRSFLPQPIQQLRPWVCTQDDVTWPLGDRVSSNKLTDLCLAHGVGVATAHRALADVMSMALLLERVASMGVSLPELFAKAMRPKRRYRAVTGRFDAGLNDKLKQAGFRWAPAANGKPGEWWRNLVIEDVPQLVASYPFTVVLAEKEGE